MVFNENNKLLLLLCLLKAIIGLTNSYWKMLQLITLTTCVRVVIIRCLLLNLYTNAPSPLGHMISSSPRQRNYRTWLNSNGTIASFTCSNALLPTPSFFSLEWKIKKQKRRKNKRKWPKLSKERAHRYTYTIRIPLQYALYIYMYYISLWYIPVHVLVRILIIAVHVY